MNPEINILELFSGIGGFTKGFQQAGFTIKRHYYSEVDKHAIANYKYNFKNSKYVGSVTDVRGSGIERPSIITFGSPCQDFSLAGKRKGMHGERSSLVTHAIRLISECRPDFFIWENVKGTFSSNNGADFWAIIQAFANIGGYRLEWQLLNGSWFLPQNRERIYLVGHLAEAGRSFKQVFPFSESDFWLNEGSAKATTVRAFTAGGHSGGHSGGHHSGMTLIHEVNPDKSFAIADSYAKGKYGKSRGTLVDQSYTCVAQRGRNPENPSDRTTGSHTEQRLEPNSQGTTNTLTSVAKDNLIQINQVGNIYDNGHNSHDGRIYSVDGLSPNTETSSGLIPKIEIKANNPFANGYPEHWKRKNGESDNEYWKRVSEQDAEYKKMGFEPHSFLLASNTKQGSEIAEEGDSINLKNISSSTRRGTVGKQKCQTLDSSSSQAVVVKQINPSIESGDKQPYQQNRIYDDEGLSPAINTESGRFQISTPNHGQRSGRQSDISPTLESHMGTGGDNVPYVNNIRRLTEIEVERLQGFPDNWTEFGIYEKQVWINKKEKTFKMVEHKYPIPATQRYKMCGNAVMVDCVQEIAERLKVNYYTE